MTQKRGAKRRADPAQTTDILDEMTRDELLAWVRSQLMSIPKRSQLLYLRWKLQGDALERDRAAELRSLDGIDFAEADRLAAACNAATSAAERLRLLELRDPYIKALSDHMKRSKALDARGKRLDRMYAQIDVERIKETRR